MKGDNKYFFDSNVIIDAFSSREGSTFYSRDLLRRVASGEIKGCLCSKQITDIFYVLRKYIPSAQERKRGAQVPRRFEERRPCRLLRWHLRQGPRGR